MDDALPDFDDLPRHVRKEILIEDGYSSLDPLEIPPLDREQESDVKQIAKEFDKLFGGRGWLR